MRRALPPLPQRGRRHASATSPPSSASDGADVSFACWFWDYDNDGRLDLFVNDYDDHASPRQWPLLMGMPVEKASRPRLYRNLGHRGLPRRDAARSASTGRSPPMGCNFGDIDNDGYLDIYLGTGWMSYSGLVPNLMFKNVDGRRFEDVTDVVRDRPPPEGARRLVRRLGRRRRPRPVRRGRRRGSRRQGVQRPVPEPRPRPPLAEGQAGRHQDQPRGARGQDPGRRARSRTGTTRSIYRTIGNNGSFGGNTLVETIGLRRRHARSPS